MDRYGRGCRSHVRIEEKVVVSEERVGHFEHPHQLHRTELYPATQLIYAAKIERGAIKIENRQMNGYYTQSPVDSGSGQVRCLPLLHWSGDL